MIDLQLCGALDRALQFQGVITPADVERLTLPPNCRKYWHRILDERDRLGNEPLVSAIRVALGRSEAAGLTSAPIHAIARGLSQIGLTKPRILAIDRRLFGGALVPLLSRLRRRAAWIR
jgi:hypothetical protein